MPKYSYNTKHSTEPIKSVEAGSKDSAIEFFSRLKVLSPTKFLELYEVKERYNSKSTQR